MILPITAMEHNKNSNKLNSKIVFSVYVYTTCFKIDPLQNYLHSSITKEFKNHEQTFYKSPSHFSSHTNASITITQPTSLGCLVNL